MTRHHPSDPRTALLQHRWLNRLQTGLLVLTLVGIAAAAGRLPFGEGCLWLALFTVAGALLLEPVAASALSLRLYRVRALHPQQAHEMWALLLELPASAGLPAMPVPHYVPSAVVNAFATGSKQEASIALTDGLLRSLSPRELAGVFAHEVAHIANEDGVRLENGNYPTLRLYFVQQWRRMRDQQFINRDSFLLKRLNGSFYINRIPECYRRRM